MSEDGRPVPKVLVDPTVTVPDLPRTTSDRPPPEPAPSAPGDAEPVKSTRDSSPGYRRRGRTLRIPDDEVARPDLTPAPRAVSAPAPPPAAAEPPPVMVTPMRIITINPAPADAPLPPVEVPPPSAPPRGAGEDSWTPYQPTVTDAPAAELARRPLSSDDILPAGSESEPPPDSVEPIEEEAAAPSPAAVGPLPVRAKAPTEPEGEDVQFEDDGAALAAPAVAMALAAPEGDRTSDPGAELGAEELETVDAAPAPRIELVAPPKAPVVANLPPMRARQASQPPVPPPKKVTAPKLGKPPLVIVPPQLGNVSPASDLAAGRKKGRLWWEDLFNDDYLRACEKLTDAQIAHEVDFIEESLSIEKGGAVLDLACGTGRHAIDLARRGYEVVGYDLSLAMLARAGDEAQDRDAKLNFIQGDMREMTFDEQFDGVFCWNTSFGYFEEEKNALVIDRIHKALKSEGLLLLDVINRDFLVRQSPSLAWFEGDGCVCMDEMNVDFITSRMRVKRTLMLDDGRAREVEYSLRVYSLHELGRILHEHGFKVCEVSGRVATPGVFFGNESPRTIILAEKR